MTGSEGEKSIWFGYYSDQINTSIQLSKDYALLAVQSLIAMNAGALLSIPPIVQVFFKEHLGFQQALIPMISFLMGLIAAIVCAYAAYFNFQYLAQSYSVELWKRLVDIDEKTDVTTFHRMKNWRATTRAEYDALERRYDAVARIWFYVANGLGIFSLLCFIGGALIFANVALAPS